ncbi:hypothetical protein PY793_12445 [Acetobacter fabarum]|uniref:hypothetical protein n=1 Tax=Acetobacter fabarum TaxID=483199 RepID=UPI00312B682D
MFLKKENRTVSVKYLLVLTLKALQDVKARMRQGFEQEWIAALNCPGFCGDVFYLN